MKSIDRLSSLLSAPLKQALSHVSEETRGTLMMRAFGFTRVPLLFLASPKITRLDSSECHVLIPYRKIVKNHVGSLYFGALAIGADVCVGMAAMAEIKDSGRDVNLIFKDFHAEFLKRAEGDTLFVCRQRTAIKELVQEAIESGERVHLPVEAEALVAGEVVAKFVLTLSLKLRK